MARSSSLVSLVSLLILLPFAPACGEASIAGGTSALSFDPCRPLALLIDDGATAAERAGAQAAVDLWNQAAGARLAVAPAGDLPAVPVHFQVAAAPSHGFYDPSSGQVLINDDLSGRPLAVTIAHELGHSFGLVHVSYPSVMNPGNLEIEPNASDVAALAELWGACAAPPDGGSSD